MNRAAVVVLCLAGIAVGSALLGGLVGWRAGQAHALRRGDPAYWADDAVARLRARLDLAPDQVAAVQADIARAATTLAALRDDTDRRTADAIGGLATAIDAHLDPRQRGEFARMRAEPPAAGLDLFRLPRLPAADPTTHTPDDGATPAAAPSPAPSSDMAAALTLPRSDQVASAIGLPAPQSLAALLPDFDGMRHDLTGWLRPSAPPSPATPATPSTPHQVPTP
jgi:hypothetical protein